MSDATTCEAKQISLNQAQRDLESCLTPEARTQMRVDNESARLGRLQDEADALWKMDVTVLTVLEREHLSGTAGASDIIHGQVTSVQTQIDDAKSQIRRERRLFLDASPSTSPAVGGVYFTRTPDNQLLILFILGYCGFLAVLSALLMVGAIPGEYIGAFTMADRAKTVAILWGAGLLLAYLVLFVFT